MLLRLECSNASSQDKEPLLWFHGARLVLVCAISLHQKIGATDPPLLIYEATVGLLSNSASQGNHQD